MTACLKDSRVLPLLDASPDKIERMRSPDTKLLLCTGSHEELTETANIVDFKDSSVNILTRFYLSDDGTIDSTRAEGVREVFKGELLYAYLYDDENIREAFIHYFPLLWEKRQIIYDNQQYFFTSSGRWCYHAMSNGSYVYSPAPIGAILKAMKNNQLFRIRPAGLCCHRYPLLVDNYITAASDEKTAWLYCPHCHKLWKTIVPELPDTLESEKAIHKAARKYDKGQGLSKLSLFDVIDELKGDSRSGRE